MGNLVPLFPCGGHMAGCISVAANMLICSMAFLHTVGSLGLQEPTDHPECRVLPAPIGH